VGQVVTCAALKGEVFKCLQCAQPWNSWDTRSRTDEETFAAGGGGKRSKVAPYSVERTTWGALPAEQAVFQPPSVRRFYQQHAQAGAVTPPVGSFALAVTAGGDGGKVTNWHCVLPVAADDAQGKQHACQVLQVLGRHLRSSIVEELAPSFSVRGIDRQVDYRAIVELALTDESMLAKFMRSLICGYDAVPSRPEFRDSEVVRKRLMAAWVCTQLLVGRQAGSGTHTVGALMSFMGWGLKIMDKKPFGEAIRDLCLSTHPETVLNAMQKRGLQLHAAWKSRIKSGDFFCERLDNIRFAKRVKPTGKSRNLELTQRSAQIVSRQEYRALGVAAAHFWVPGPTREQVASDVAKVARFSTEAACEQLNPKYDSLLCVSLKLVKLSGTDTPAEALQRAALVEDELGASTRSRRSSDDSDADSDDELLEANNGDDVSESLVGEAGDGHANLPEAEVCDDEGGGGADGRGVTVYGSLWRVERVGDGFILRRKKEGERLSGSSDLAPNNAVMMPILEKDFSKGETLEFASFTASKWRDVVMQQAQDDDFQAGEVQCPLKLRHVQVPLLVDGKPCYQAQLYYVLPAIRIEENTFFSLGGWHLVNVARKHKCRLFELFIVPLIKLYGRDSLGRILWFMDPSDPRQCSSECRAILAAIHTSAGRAYQRAIQRKDVQGPASAAGLRTFMRERASSTPLVRGILAWCKLEAAIEAIQESAGDRDAAAYYALLPILGMVFSFTHATQYAQMVWEELVHRETLSEAERAIFKELIFARTAAGTSVFSDYWVEVTNRFLRHYCGRMVVGRDDKFLAFINGVLLDMENLQAQSGAHSGSSKHAFDLDGAAIAASEHVTLLGKVFTTTLEAIDSVNVWGAGPVTPLPRRKGGKRAQLPAASYVTIDGLRMSRAWFRWPSTGEERCAWFRAVALKTGGWRAHDKDSAKPSIALVPALKKSQTSDSRAQWILKWSCDEDTLSQHNGVTAVFLKGEMSRLHTLLQKQPPRGATCGVADMLKVVCELRVQEQDSMGGAPEEPVNQQDIDLQNEDDTDAQEMMDHPLMQ